MDKKEEKRTMLTDDEMREASGGDNRVIYAYLCPICKNVFKSSGKCTCGQSLVAVDGKEIRSRLDQFNFI